MHVLSDLLLMFLIEMFIEPIPMVYKCYNVVVLRDYVLISDNFISNTIFTA